MNKQTIISVLLALVAMAGTSDAFNFRIDHEDVAIAVNKDILALCKRQSRARRENCRWRSDPRRPLSRNRERPCRCQS